MTVIIDDKADEISNEDLKAQRNHRREHRREKFVDVGRDVMSDGRTIKKRKRVEQDHRLIELLGDGRVEAMDLIRAAFMMITTGMGMQTFNPFKTPGGAGDIHAGMQLMTLYWAWARELQVRRLDHALCIAIAVEGMTPNACVIAYRRDRRTVLNNLTTCLDVAIDMGILKLAKKGG